MKILDRYIIRELVLPIFFCCFILIFLILIADLFDNLTELIRNNTPTPIIIKYYLSLIPFAFTQTLPWATWAGTIFLLVNFGTHNEMLAMKAAGLEITSIIRPIIFVGFIVGILAFWVSDKLVPSTLQTADQLRETYIELNEQPANQTEVLENITYYSEKEKLFYFRTFSKEQKKVTGAIVLWLDGREKNIRRKTLAGYGLFEENRWVLYDVTEYLMDTRGRVLGEPRTYATRAYPDMTFTPAELLATTSKSEYLSYGQLKYQIKKLIENGVNVFSEKVDLHSRLAAPWQGLVMMLISIPLLSRTTTRKLIAVKVLICVALVFSFHVSGAVGIAFGKASKIFPFISAWAGNILFSAGALFSLEKANH